MDGGSDKEILYFSAGCNHLWDGFVSLPFHVHFGSVVYYGVDNCKACSNARLQAEVFGFLVNFDDAATGMYIFCESCLVRIYRQFRRAGSGSALSRSPASRPPAKNPTLSF